MNTRRRFLLSLSAASTAAVAGCSSNQDSTDITNTDEGAGTEATSESTEEPVRTIPPGFTDLLDLHSVDPKYIAAEDYKTIRENSDSCGKKTHKWDVHLYENSPVSSDMVDFKSKSYVSTVWGFNDKFSKTDTINWLLEEGADLVSNLSGSTALLKGEIMMEQQLNKDPAEAAIAVGEDYIQFSNEHYGLYEKTPEEIIRKSHETYNENELNNPYIDSLMEELPERMDGRLINLSNEERSYQWATEENNSEIQKYSDEDWFDPKKIDKEEPSRTIPFVAQDYNPQTGNVQLKEIKTSIKDGIEEVTNRKIIPITELQYQIAPYNTSVYNEKGMKAWASEGFDCITE